MFSRDLLTDTDHACLPARRVTGVTVDLNGGILIRRIGLPDQLVIPAEAGIQFVEYRLDSRSPIKDFEDKFHGNDEQIPARNSCFEFLKGVQGDHVRT